MGSLRSFHLLFILLAMVAADLFGVWAVYDYVQTHQASTLALGIVSMVGGLGLLAYAVWFIHKLDRAHIQ